MLIEAKYPIKYDPKKYDEYLERGFFRGASMMYKTQLLCLRNSIGTVINIRLPLIDHKLSKSQRKLVRKVERDFRTEVRPYHYTQEQEDLYQQQKNRFTGFLYPDLESFLSMGTPLAFSLFNTYQVEVYDGDELVAFSLFDIGYKSMASLLAAYKPEYHKYSLGTYTMLKEVQSGIYRKLEYFYPGYVLSNTGEFNYKLRVGDVEYLDWEQGWLGDYDPQKQYFLSDKIEDKTNALERELDKTGARYKKYYYPNFSLGYILPTPTVFKNPVYLALFNTGIRGDVIFEYDFRKDIYRLAVTDLVNHYPSNDKLEISEDYRNTDNLDLELREYCKVLWKGGDPREGVSLLATEK